MQNAAALDLESDSVRQFIALLKNNGVAVDPTLAFIEPSLRTASYRVRADIAPVLDRLSAGFGRGWVGWTMVDPDSMAEVAARGFANLKKLVRKLHEAGIPVLPGTDGAAGFTLHRELELYTEAGIAPAEVLYLATLGAARVMGMDATFGSIAVGKRADMILVDGDPLRAMSEIGRVILTMKGGALYDPALMYRALAIEPCCPDQ
jgi:imidazolonepropionase-like amidohydrolase